MLETSCQSIDKGFSFVNMVNYFEKVLSDKKNILKCGEILLISQLFTLNLLGKS